VSVDSLLKKKMKKKYLKATLAKRATVGPQKVTAIMTPAALNAGDRIFVCWIKTTSLRESNTSPAVERKES
jgi:hypothetical protein